MLCYMEADKCRLPVLICKHMEKKMAYKEKNSGKDKQGLGQKIAAHRRRVILGTLLAVVLTAAFAYTFYVQIKNQTYTGYTVVSEVNKQIYSQAEVRVYRDGYLSYSRDGISYTDSKGNAVWNQTYEMQSPLVEVKGDWVAVGDYNGHLIYDIGPDGTAREIDTHLPIRSLTVAGNGVVAAVLEDSDVTWINVYNPNGENAVGIKTTMQKSGYPVSISLADSGKLLQVAYLRVESGSMKSVVSFYNFDEVGQNYTDTMVSSYEFAEAVVPMCAFMDATTAFSVADNHLVLYEGAEIPKNICQNMLSDEIKSVFYGSSYIALVYVSTDGSSKYRADVYDSKGNLVIRWPFLMEYKDIVFSGENMIIYNEAECNIVGLNGTERYDGDITKQTALLKPLGSSRYLAVTSDSLKMIEMR